MFIIFVFVLFLANVMLTVWIVGRIQNKYLTLYEYLGRPDKGLIFSLYFIKNYKFFYWLLTVKLKELPDQKLILCVLGLRLVWFGFVVSLMSIYID